jgi:hypothetical protein
MRLRIKQARPINLNDTIRHAVELEAFNKAELKRNEGGGYLRSTGQCVPAFHKHDIVLNFDP